MKLKTGEATLFEKLRTHKLFLLFLSLSLVYLVQLSGAFFTEVSVGSWYRTLNKPFWNPPRIAFAVIWPFLYTLMGLSLWCALIARKKKTWKLLLPFFVQLFLNFTWSFVFFYWRSPHLAFVNIVLLLIALAWNMKVFYRHDKRAAYLLVPYFLWVFYASSLNLAIWYLN